MKVVWLLLGLTLVVVMCRNYKNELGW